MINSTMTTSILQERINNLINACIDKYYQKGIKIPERSLTITQHQGRKYIKLILKVKWKNHLNDASEETWCFIDGEGNVYKPASYREPVRQVRYNLLNDSSYAAALHKADWAGGFLYADVCSPPH